MSNEEPGAQANLPVQALLDASNDELAVLGPHGLIVARNTAWMKAGACAGPSMSTGAGGGVDYRDVWRDAGTRGDVASAVVDGAIAGITAVLRGERESFTLELVMSSGTGRRWYRLGVTSLAPAARGVVVSHADISRWKQAEEALAVNQSRMGSLVRHGMEAISIADANGIIVYEAPGIERVLGFRPEELVGREMPGLHPDDVASVQPIMAELARDPGGHRSFRMRIRHKDGAYRTLFLTGTNMLHDPAVNGMVYNFHDISDLLASEQELRFQNELLNQAWVAVIALNPDGTVRHWNDHAARVYGWTPDEAIGRAAIDLIVREQDRERVNAIIHMLRQGEGWEGEMVCLRKDRTTIDVRVNASALRDTDNQVIGIVAIAIDISERRRMEEQLRDHAVHDALTGLPNRVLLYDRLEQVLSRLDRRHQHVAVLFIDLDRFKLVNDSFGHAIGDIVLQCVAARFTEVLPRTVTLSRLSGDEFIVLLDSVHDEDEAVRIAQHLLDALAAPFDAGDHHTSIGASIGIAIGVAGRSDADTLLRQADSALYRVKATRRGAIIVHDQSTSQESARFLDLKRDLRQALDRGEFILHFQPIVSLRTGKITEAEALIRWEHPRYGVIAPAEFISTAADMGLLIQIGRWVAREASRQASRWVSQPPNKPVALSINLSAHELADPVLAQDLRCALADSDFDPHRLILEITEDVLINDMSSTIATLAQLRASGIRIMIDDFGSGYSSLGYLRELPVDGVKLDRAFVQGLGTEAGSIAIVEAIIQMAHALGLRVTAEGIETPEQLGHLRQLGCDFGQGYLFARPSAQTTWSSPVDLDAIVALSAGSESVLP